MKYLITGVAGFIGFHLTKRLLQMNETIVGIDNLNDYYDVRLKYNRLTEIGIVQTEFEYNEIVTSSKHTNFKFVKIDIADKITLNELFAQNDFDIVCNFAAQAGIMYSTINPNAFVHSNIVGFVNILECCKEYNSKLIYASSSNVYGNNTKLPFAETDSITTPKNLYAKTKISNEQLAQIYSDHFGLQIIGLRLFSVYGIFGRPDMAI
jgi:UDP-glucuronate 4-epimerase